MDSKTHSQAATLAAGNDVQYGEFKSMELVLIVIFLSGSVQLGASVCTIV